jgi:hypothetical protein
MSAQLPRKAQNQLTSLIRISARQRAGLYAHPDAGYFGEGAAMNPPAKQYKDRASAKPAWFPRS